MVSFVSEFIYKRLLRGTVLCHEIRRCSGPRLCTASRHGEWLCVWAKDGTKGRKKVRRLVIENLPGISGAQIDSDDGAYVLVLFLLFLGQCHTDAEGHDGQ